MRALGRSLVLLVVGCCAGAVQAGSLCGNVRDASTQAPIPGVELVLFQNNAITPYQGASDALGAFCILDVPPGTYDLRARVDDYRTNWTAGVVVTETPTAVDVIWRDDLRFDAPWPNPGGDQISFRIGRAIDAAFALRLYDARGRFVRGWDGSLAAGQTRVVAWDFRDADRRTLPSGVYFATVTSDGQTVRRRVVHVR